MARPLVALVALPLLFISAAAWAACSDELAELEQRLQRLETQAAATAGSQGSSDQAEVQRGSTKVTVEAEEGGVEPDENWFGSPASLEDARDQLESARALAEDGDEDGCMGRVGQARPIIDQLER